jgi:hypothetical protein
LGKPASVIIFYGGLIARNPGTGNWMNRRRTSTPFHRHQTPYERLSRRIEEVAERDGRYSNAAIIRRMRESFFADVDALAKSGTVRIPE